MHQSVLVDEVWEGLAPRPGGRYIDATAGGGGHTQSWLERTGGKIEVLLMDRDPAVVGTVNEALRAWPGAWHLTIGNFERVEELATAVGFTAVDGILFDLGLSSNQLDDPERGFSFQADGPLDMRMNLEQGRTAADLVNELSVEELADVFWRYGEESESRSIAREIGRARMQAPFRSTAQLVEVIVRTKRGRRRIHPATQCFQALRIAVNGELTALERGLEGALRLLRPGGRVALISFHSLEDRMVKQCLARHAGRWESLQAGGQEWVGAAPAVRLVTRKPRIPSEAENRQNPRARSAKLRIAERID